jgi:hypothetical protein
MLCIPEEKVIFGTNTETVCSFTLVNSNRRIGTGNTMEFAPKSPLYYGSALKILISLKIDRLESQIIKSFGSNKPKGLNRIVTIGSGHLCLRRTLVLLIITKSTTN